VLISQHAKCWEPRERHACYILLGKQAALCLKTKNAQFYKVDMLCFITTNS